VGEVVTERLKRGNEREYRVREEKEIKEDERMKRRGETRM
jgi:hypothetical protein